MITLDTSGLLAIVDRRDPHHASAKDALLADPGPYLVPAGTMCEIGYFLSRRGSLPALDRVLADLEEGAFALDCGYQDLARVRELIRRYADLPLGYTVAAVVACAERNGGSVLTLDRRDFDVVAKEGRITVLPG